METGIHVYSNHRSFHSLCRCLPTSLVSVRELENQGLCKVSSVASTSAFLMKSQGVRYVFVGMWKGVN